jgi:3-oxoadipate enol-lactonase
VPDARTQLTDSLSRLRKANYLKMLDAIADFDGYDGLATIKVPTLVVVGSDDRLTPPAWGRELASKIPGAEYVEIEGAGHVSNLDQPEAFNSTLLRFLRQFR